MAESFIVRKGGIAGESFTITESLENINLQFHQHPQDSAIDADFVYFAGWGFTVGKFHKSNLVRVGNTASYGSIINAIEVDDEFIYAGGQTPQQVYKYHKGNLVFAGNSAAYPSQIRVLKIDDSFIFVSGFQSNATIQRIHKGNLSLSGTSVGIGGRISYKSLDIDGDFVYVGSSNASLPIKKYYKSNFTFVGATAPFDSQHNVIVDTNFIYASGADNIVKKIYKNNLALAGNSAVHPDTIWAMAITDEFIYTGRNTNNTIRQFHKSNLSFIKESPTIAARTNTITADSEFLYISTVQDYLAKMTSKETLTLENQSQYIKT